MLSFERLLCLSMVGPVAVVNWRQWQVVVGYGVSPSGMVWCVMQVWVECGGLRLVGICQSVQVRAFPPPPHKRVKGNPGPAGFTLEVPGCLQKFKKKAQPLLLCYDGASLKNCCLRSRRGGNCVCGHSPPEKMRILSGMQWNSKAACCQTTGIWDLGQC